MPIISVSTAAKLNPKPLLAVVATPKFPYYQYNNVVRLGRSYVHV